MIGFLGMGLGPFLPGVLSDALEPIYGTDSLGYSLILMSMLWPWAAFHFFLANRTIARDIARAEVEIGRASCRERVCQYVSFQVVPVTLQKQQPTHQL